MAKYTIVICDDDVRQANNLSLKVGIALSMVPTDNMDIDYEVGKVASKYQDVLDYLDNNKIDGGIYFLDIELDDNKNGVDLAVEIKKRDERAQIIFITAYNEYMPMTFERRIGAVDYINKLDPHFQSRLNYTVKDALISLDKNNLAKKFTFTYRFGRQIKNINMDNVLYICTTKSAHKLLLVADNMQSEFVGDIKAVDEKNELLVKISQSCLINPKNAKTIDLRKRTITMNDGTVLKFSRRFKHKMKDMTENHNLAVNETRFLS